MKNKFLLNIIMSFFTITAVMVAEAADDLTDVRGNTRISSGSLVQVKELGREVADKGQPLVTEKAATILTMPSNLIATILSFVTPRYAIFLTNDELRESRKPAF